MRRWPTGWGDGWTLPALATAVVVAATGWWIASHTSMELREQLRSLTFWWMELELGLVVVLGALAVRQGRAHLAAERRHVVAVALAGLLALFLASGVAPRTSRIFYDEQIYQGIGQNLADLKIAQMCNEGIVEYGRLQCSSGEYNKQPNAYPHLLSVLYRAFGTDPEVAHRLNAVVLLLLAWTAFFTTTLLFSDPDAGCLASVLIATIPMQVVWGNTAAVEPSAELAILLAVGATALFVKARTTTTLLFAASASAYACGFRPESPLVLAPVVLAVVLLAPQEIRRTRTGWGGVLGLLLLAPLAVHVAALAGDPWGAGGQKLGLSHVSANFRTNAGYYLGDGRFAVLYTILAAGGAAVALRRGKGRAAAVLGVTFLAFWGIYLLFYAGSYNYGADVRYSLMTFPAIACLGGLGSAWALRAASLKMGSAGKMGVAAVLIVNVLWYLPLMRATGEEAWAARADVRFARRVRSEVAGNAMVLTHNPSLFHVMGVNAAQASLATTAPEHVGQMMERYAGRLYFHWNFWCNVADPVQVEFCRNVLGRFDARTVHEYRERDYRYRLYRLDRTRADAPAPTRPGAGARDGPSAGRLGSAR